MHPIFIQQKIDIVLTYMFVCALKMLFLGWTGRTLMLPYASKVQYEIFIDLISISEDKTRDFSHFLLTIVKFWWKDFSLLYKSIL